MEARGQRAEARGQTPDLRPLTSIPTTLRAILAYNRCESLTAGLICFMVIFSPWAFGTTQPWSIWVLDATGMLLGLFLAVKLLIRRFAGYQPGVWDGDPTGDGKSRIDPAVRFPRLIGKTLATLTLAIGWSLRTT